MLEWYEKGASYRDLLGVQEELLEAVRKKLKIRKEVTVRGKKVSLARPFRQMTMREAFWELRTIDLDKLQDFAALAECASRFAIEPSALDTQESLFHKIFLQEIEPVLPADRPLFLLDYPAFLPTLAYVKEDALYAERWELFIAGIEIANCYTEERREERIKRFFQSEEAKKEKSVIPHKTDWELVGIAGKNLPPCSGNAMGVDRLLMVLLGADTIDEVVPFPLPWS
jgi:lysyl-tRNA synthetase class 2